MATNYATYYAQALSQAYPYMLRFGALYARKQEGDYKWLQNGSHTIMVPSVSVSGRVDANRNNITALSNRQQRHSNQWTPLTLRNHRKWDDFIHPLDIDETNQVLTIQNITRQMNEQEKFPEMDRYLISTLYADWIALGRVPLSAALSTANVLTYFDKMMVMMTEHNVPGTGRILYVNPNVNLLLKGAIQWYRTQNVQGTAPAAIQRALASIDNVTVEEVPSDSMKTVYDFTVGAVPGASAKQIQMFLVHPSSVITPEEYDFVSLDPPSTVSEGKWMYFEESYNDAFILPNKQYGIEFLVDDLASGAATFTSAANTAADAAVGDTLITMTAPVSTNVKPGSKYFYAVDASTAPTALAYGEIATNNSEWTAWDGKNTTVLNITNGYKITILVTDADGRVYASGSGTITSKTA